MKKSTDWREHLSGKEYVEYDDLTRKAHEIDTRRKEITKQLAGIRARCSVRRLRAIGKVTEDRS